MVAFPGAAVLMSTALMFAVKRSALIGCCFVLQSFACPHLSK